MCDDTEKNKAEQLRLIARLELLTAELEKATYEVFSTIEKQAKYLKQQKEKWFLLSDMQEKQ